MVQTPDSPLAAGPTPRPYPYADTPPVNAYRNDNGYGMEMDPISAFFRALTGSIGQRQPEMGPNVPPPMPDQRPPMPAPNPANPGLPGQPAGPQFDPVQQMLMQLMGGAQ
jgi:hypothetical protein